MDKQPLLSVPRHAFTHRGTTYTLWWEDDSDSIHHKLMAWVIYWDDGGERLPGNALAESVADDPREPRALRSWIRRITETN